MGLGAIGAGVERSMLGNIEPRIFFSSDLRGRRLNARLISRQLFGGIRQTGPRV